MSDTPASFISAPTPSSPPSSSSPLDNNGSTDSEATGGAQYYNYFFLLLAVAFLLLFLLLFYFQRRSKAQKARLQQHGRAALVQDVSRFPPPPAAPLWNRRTADEPPRPLNRLRGACHDSILDAGLDERGEAPPPYITAAADKAPPMSRGETIQPARLARLAVSQAPVGEGMVGRLPPGYRETDGSEEGMGRPARPGAVVVATNRLAGADLEAQSRHDIHRSRILPRSVGRWSSRRRLMSSTEGSV